MWRVVVRDSDVLSSARQFPSRPDVPRRRNLTIRDSNILLIWWTSMILSSLSHDSPSSSPSSLLWAGEISDPVLHSGRTAGDFSLKVSHVKQKDERKCRRVSLKPREQTEANAGRRCFGLQMFWLKFMKTAQRETERALNGGSHNSNILKSAKDYRADAGCILWCCVCVWSDSLVQSSVIMAARRSDSERVNVFITGLCAKWKWADGASDTLVSSLVSWSLWTGLDSVHSGGPPSTAHSPALTLNSQCVYVQAAQLCGGTIMRSSVESCDLVFNQEAH